MYASVVPQDIGVNLFLLTPDHGPITSLLDGPVTGHVYRIQILTGDQLQELEREDLPPQDDRALFRRATFVNVLGRQTDAQAFIEQAQRSLADRIKTDVAVLLVSKPRLDVRKRLAYTETVAYLARGSEILKIGTYATDQQDAVLILRDVNKVRNFPHASPADKKRTLLDVEAGDMSGRARLDQE